MRAVVRLIYRASVCGAETFRFLYAKCVAVPVLRAVARGGAGLHVERIPYIRGPGQITIGKNARISGKIGIAFSRHGRDPALHIGDRVFIGHQSSFAIAESIRIGDDCLIANGVQIADNDGHPLDAKERLLRKPVPAEAVRPVEIGKNVWIGARARILKGVKIGDNAVIGAESVVTKDVAPDTLVAGNPARIIRTIS